MIVPNSAGTQLYVWGKFTKMNGGHAVARGPGRRGTTGARVNAFKPAKINSAVFDLRLRGSQLLVGGSFSTAGGLARPGMVSLDASTGVLTNYFTLPIAGTAWGKGVTTVRKFDLTPSGDRMVMMGNFNSVAGQSRLQIAMVDLTDAGATLANWSTQRFKATGTTAGTSLCARAFDSYMRDIDISPDGSFFLVVTTGAYRAGTLCDAASRWETYATGDQVETWSNYTGGDTFWGLQVTGPIAYVGGHFRWLNNPYAGDRASVGAVAREGIAAIDTRNGLPLSWNPGRERGVGLFDFDVTASEVWAGSDTDRWGSEYRPRVAGFPLVGGHDLPVERVGSLPADVVLLDSPAAGVSQETGSSTAASVQGSRSDVAAADWSLARGAVMIDDTVYMGWADSSTVGSLPRAQLRRHELRSGDLAGALRQRSDHRQPLVQRGHPADHWHVLRPGEGPPVLHAEAEHCQQQRRVLLPVLHSRERCGRRPALHGAERCLDRRQRQRNHVPTGDVPRRGQRVLRRCRRCAEADRVHVRECGRCGWRVRRRHPRRRLQRLAGQRVLRVDAADLGRTEHTAQRRCCRPSAVVSSAPSTPRAASTQTARWSTYSFDFGDGSSSAATPQATQEHTYGVGGPYEVTVTVTDNRGGTATASQTVHPAPIVSPIAARASGQYASTGSLTQHVFTIPAEVQDGDQMVVVTTGSSSGTVVDPAGWTRLDDEVDGDVRSVAFARTATGGDAGSTLAFQWSSPTKATISFAAYSGVAGVAATVGSTEPSITGSPRTPRRACPLRWTVPGSSPTGRTRTRPPLGGPRQQTRSFELRPRWWRWRAPNG